jgi:hypothetical protein
VGTLRWCDLAIYCLDLKVVDFGAERFKAFNPLTRTLFISAVIPNVLYLVGNRVT